MDELLNGDAPGEALAALAPHLAVLDLARNRLAEVRGLAALRGLRVLDLSANELAHMKAYGEKVSWPTLKKAIMKQSVFSPSEGKRD